MLLMNELPIYHHAIIMRAKPGEQERALVLDDHVV